MHPLENIVITSVNDVLLVESIAGKHTTIQNRPYYGLSFCKSGRITYEHNGVYTVSHPGNAVILPQGETYRIIREETGEFPVISFSCDSSFVLQEHLAIPLHHPASYMHEFEQIRELFLFPYQRFKVISLLYDMLHRLISEKNEYDYILTPVLQYIENHYHEPDISNKLLADKARISEVYLRKLFGEQMGISPKQYIIRLRLERSKQMLIESNLTVTEIAECCGFVSLTHYCHTFRELCGISPREYRYENRKKL